MKKRVFKALITLVISVFVSGVVLACTPTVGVTDVSINMPSVTLEIGDTEQLEATVLPKNASSKKVNWVSNNLEVATVSSTGLVTAVSAGKATITASAGSKDDICRITVTEPSDEIKVDGYIYHEDFNGRTTVPNYFRKDMSGDGAASVLGGELTLSAVQENKAFLIYDFEETLSGKIIAETRVQAVSNSFANIFFFYRGETGSSVNDIVLSIGMEAGKFKNNANNTWTNIADYSLFTWYNLRVVMDTDTSTFDLFISDSSSAETKYAGLSFRKTGEGYADSISLLKFGTERAGGNIVFDYIKISDYASTDSACDITTNITTYYASLADRTAVLNYNISGVPTPSVTVTPSGGNPSDDVTIASDNKTITFGNEAVEGVYFFTVRVENLVDGVAKSVEKEFKVYLQADADVLFSADFAAMPDEIIVEERYGTAEVEEGKLRFTTPDTGNKYTSALYDFGFSLSGQILAETILINNSETGHFINVFFFYTAGTTIFTPANCTVSVAIDNGVLKYRPKTASDWVSIMPLENGVPYEISALLDFDEETINIYVDGVAKLLNGEFRSTGAETSVFMMGSESNGCDFGIDNLSFIRAVAPTITIDEDNTSLNLDDENSYSLGYEITSDITGNIDISCDMPGGYNYYIDDIDGEIDFSFTSTGTFVFTITVSNKMGASSVIFTANVEGTPIEPTITLTSSEDAEVALFETYHLQYDLSGSPVPSVTLDCDRNSGYAFNAVTNKITFTKSGVYNFTLIATNSEGEDDTEFTVTIIDPFESAAENAAVIYNEDFDGTTKPDSSTGLSTDATLNGSVVFSEDGYAKISRTNSGNAFMYVEKNLSGVVLTEIKFYKEANSKGFINLLFFQNNGGDNAMSIGVRDTAGDENKLAYRGVNGGAWQNLTYIDGSNVLINASTWYTFRVVHNFTTKKASLFILVGEAGSDNVFDYLGEISFTTTVSPNKVRIGTNAIDTFFKVDYIKHLQLLPSVTADSSVQLDLIPGPATYTPSYTPVNIDASLTVINCTTDVEEGYTFDGDEFTFTKEGEYTITVTVANVFGSDSTSIVVTVVETMIAPTIDVTSEKSATVALHGDPTYTVNYDATGAPEPTVTLSCDKSTGYEYDEETGVITFHAAGTFNFTLTATNREDEDSDTFTVTVTDIYGESETADATEMYLENFSGANKPGDLTLSVTGGSSSVDFSEDGYAKFSRVSDGTAFATKELGTVSGIVLTEVKFRYDIGSTGFARIMTFFDSAVAWTASVVVNDGGYLASNLGGTGWTNMSYQGGEFKLLNNMWYTLRAVCDFENEEIYVYLSGEQVDNGSEISFSEGQFIYLGKYDFRNKGRTTSKLMVGTDSNNTYLTIDYIKLSQLLPDVIITESAKSVSLDDPTYTLGFTASANSTSTEITCDKTEGADEDYTISGEVVTFLKTGTFTFTVEVTNAFGSVSKTIVVTVTGARVAPEFTASPDGEDEDLTLQDVYELDYTVTGSPVPDVDLFCADSGWHYDNNTKKISFSKAGTYSFVLTATNGFGTDATASFTITVSDIYGNLENATVTYFEDFSGVSKPEGITISATGIAPNIGSVDFSNNGYVTMTRLGSAGSAEAFMFVGKEIEGIALTEIKFKKEAGSKFVNLLFFYNNTTNAMNLGIRDGADQNRLAYRNVGSGGTWQNLTYQDGEYALINDETWYTVRVVHNFINTKAIFYILEGDETAENGFQYLDTIGFSNSVMPDRVRIGTNAYATAVYVDYIKYLQLLPDLVKDTAIVAVDTTYSPVLTANADKARTEISLATGSGSDCSITDDEITFTGAGTFTFDIRIENEYGVVTRTLSVTVDDTSPALSPSITLTSSDEASLSMITDTLEYTVAYDLDGFPTPSVSLTCEKSTGWYYNDGNKKITLYAEGAYSFTLTASNDIGETDTDTFTITVTDPYGNASGSTIYSEDFSGTDEPADFNVVPVGSGSADFSEDGYAKFGRVKDVAGSVFATKELGTVSGLVLSEVKFRYDIGSTGFARIMTFFDSAGAWTASVVVSDNGVLSSNLTASGANWVNISYKGGEIKVLNNMWYTLRAVCDFENEKLYVYLSGEQVNNGSVISFSEEDEFIYLGEFDFRNKGKTTTRLMIGTDSSNTYFTIDDIKISQLPSGETPT